MRLLDGVVVIDLGNFITAPLAAMILGEMGADVIKVERPSGDPFREFAGGSYSPHFQAHNRNKRSVVLEYDQPGDASRLRGLIAQADVLIMNTRPGVAERLGLDYAAVHAANPRLIHCAVTGFGQDGPYAQRAAFDNVGQALSGWMSRFRVGDDPRVLGPAVSDAATGLYAAIAILGALHERHTSGIGRRIDVSMLEATIALAAEPVAQYLASGRVPPVLQRAAMSQAYTLTCGDGKRIGIHLSSPDKFWRELCQVLGKQAWIAEFPTRMDRVRGYEEIGRRLNTEFGRHARHIWLERLANADLPYAPEYDIDDLENDPQVRHLGTFYDLDHPKMGSVRAVHRPFTVDGDRTIDFRPPPTLGEHQHEIFAVEEAEAATEDLFQRDDPGRLARAPAR